MNQSKNGYYAHEEILKTFSLYNIKYRESSKSLVLNTVPTTSPTKRKNFFG